jgi:hypothetical protein
MDLRPHPDTPCPALERLSATVAREGDRLRLAYTGVGAIAALRWPTPIAPDRTDGLWQTTCFEAFVQAGGEPAYAEFNFAPSGAWAAYQFDAYRAGMAPLAVPAPLIAATRAATGFELVATLILPGPGPWRLGLSAVIEDQAGAKSYWALAHPPGKPDFHHPDCFALALEHP